MDKPNVCAIIPAYKEEKRIEYILKELKKSKLINEILVVDDGSKDNTCLVCKKYKVKVIKNKKNLGKAGAMNKGVYNTKSDIIFFCDADLIDFTYKMADSTIKSLIKNSFDMVVCTRRRINNKLTLWSGQRAIKRELWERMPMFYKKGFRVELGLNLFCNSYKTVFFRYNQYMKEDKRGLFYGLYRRFFMLLDIFVAYFGFIYYFVTLKLIERYIKYIN